MNARCALGLALGLVLAGCGDDGTPAPAPVAARGAVEGFAFVPAARQAGAVVVARTGTPPAGHLAAAGATVAEVGGGATTTTDATGHFRLDGVVPGLRQIRVSLGAAVGTFGATVVPEAAVLLGEPATGRAAAVDAARQALAALELNGVPLDPDTAAIFAPQQPLPAGVEVSELLAAAARATTVTLASESWLVYADLAPTAGFAHEVRWFVIDADTGDLSEHRAESPPLLNGAAYYFDYDANRTSPDLVSAPPAALRPVPEPLESPPLTRDHTSSTTTPQLFGMVILGDRRPDFVTDFNTVGGFMGAQGATWFAVSAPSPGRPTINAQGEVLATFTHINQQLTHDLHDTLYVSLHSHGLPNGTSPFMQVVVKDGQVPAGATHNFSLTSLPWGQVRACHIIIHIDTCFAEAHLNAMKALIEGSPGLFAGKKVTIVAASAADEIALGGSPPDPPGGYFTTPFIATLRGLAAVPVTIDQVVAAFDATKPRTEAATKDFPVNWDGPQARGTQHPVKYVKPMLPGETCGAGGATVTGVTLSTAVSLDGAVVLPAGAKVPIGWLQDFEVVPPHTPVTAEMGCEETHLHAAAGSEGIRIRLPDGRVAGPVPDPDRSHCGYGPVGAIPFPAP